LVSYTPNPQFPLHVLHKSRQASSLVLAWVLLLWVQGCGSESGGNGNGVDSLAGNGRFGPGGCQLLSGRNTIKIDNIEVEIWVPEVEPRADILLLPGWNFTRNDWCEKTLLCRKALHEGYRLIMPEMGKSIYASRYYPETRADWRTYPTGTWLADTLIPDLQKKYCLFQENGENYVIGLSTGGRGVAMIDLLVPGLFKSGAAFSGDYDQTLMKGDNLMRGFYGDYEQFPERWEGEDNPAFRVKEINIPLYLSHGKKDQMVPWQQTEHFYKLMRKAHPDLQLTLSLPEESGHDFAFWGNEVDNALAFFEKVSHSPAEGL
jgi:pimeloyl-ACP methyl ester carboxylesterase